MDRTLRQQAHFDGIASRYREARRHRNHLALKDLIWREALAGLTDVRAPGVRVLEPMCGFADGQWILERQFGVSVDYRGFDFSEAVVDSLARSRPDLAVWQQDVTRFEPTEEVDIVILLGGLHHVPHMAGPVVARCAGALRPGGYFINFEPTHGNPLFRAVRDGVYRRNSLFDEATERAFSVDELFGFFTAAGLQPVQVLYPGLLSYVLYYNPDAFPILNIGGPGLVERLWRTERPFLRGRLARCLSFATLGVWRRPVAED